MITGDYWGDAVIPAPSTRPTKTATLDEIKTALEEVPGMKEALEAERIERERKKKE